MRRREFVKLIASSVVACAPSARAQQPGKVYRIGFLANDPTIPSQAAGKAFVEGLRQVGFVEGKNIVIERRFAEGVDDRSAEFAAELVVLDVDLIVVSGQNNAKAAKQATRKIPIVMANVFDPIGLGIVTNLASPEGNVTGLGSDVSPEMAGKRLELLKEAVPAISNVAVLMNSDSRQDRLQWDAAGSAARSLQMTLQEVTLRRGADLEGALNILRHGRPDALFGLYSGPILFYRQAIVDFASESRLPAMYATADLPAAGGLMSYGVSRTELFRHSTTYVAKILDGTKPSDLPIEQPAKFEFVINLKAAKALGLEIPPGLLARADEVIE